MLNGKFYTGLTPKQINRCGAAQNRQESHFFWPDDTKVESAVETRLKRRASLQYEQVDKPRIQRQASVEECDAINKDRFHNEFAKSSIHFNDNIEEQPEAEGQYQGSRAQAIIKARSARREIAPKPTATRLELPDKVIDEEYTTAKKQQTYNSKIQFYDFVDAEELNNANRNNSRKFVDMNDKRELERNAKNSPKLQIKRNVSCYSEAEEVPEGKFRNDSRDSKRIQAEPIRNNQSEEQSRMRRGHEATRHWNEERSAEANKLRHNNNSSPKYQNNNQQRRMWNTESKGSYYADEDQDDLNYIENNMRNLAVNGRTAPRHVSYQDTYAPYREDDYSGRNPKTSYAGQREGAVKQQQPGNNERQQKQRRPHSPEFCNGEEEEMQYMETCRRPATTKNYNNNVNKQNNNSTDNMGNNNKYNNNNNEITKRQISPKMSSTAAITAATELEPIEPTMNSHKHLRSNIFLNDTVPTSTTPTSKFRRYARNSAVQRVSVGLPD